MDHWPTAILVVLITMLLTLLSKMYDILTGVDSSQQLLQYVADLMSGRSTQQALITLLRSGSADFPFNLLDIAGIIVMPILTLGCIRYMLMRHRGDDSASVHTLLFYKEYFWPALKLSLMTSLRILGWMLPGILLIIIGVVQTESNAGSVGAGLLIVLSGIGVMFGLERWASYRYSMAMYFMTENPEMSAKDCIQSSLDMMAHRKMQLFMLELSFILFELGIMLVQLLLAGLLGSMMAAVLGLVLHLPVQTYLEASAAAFFLEFRPQYEKEQSLLERWNNGNQL